MAWLWHDLRFACRMLRKNLWVTILAIGSLTLGIAGNTAVFSLVDGMLYRPLAYAEPERLAVICERPREMSGVQLTPSSAANFLDWRERQSSFQQLAAMRVIPLSLEHGNGEREQLRAMTVTPGMFGLLGARPFRGRFFLPEEGIPGNHHVVILSHGFWVEHFGGEGDPVGNPLNINGEPYEIVGVLDAEFEFIDPNLELYVPLALDLAQLKRFQRDVMVLGRLRPGITHEQARSEMTLIARQLEDRYPVANRGYTVSVINSREWFPDPGNRILLKLMQGGMFFVLLIACANIANLLLARGQHREREIAIRTSLGARRLQILRQLFTESMLTALPAGILGFALAALAAEFFAKAMAHRLPKAFAPMVDSRMFLFNLALTLLGGVLFGLAPVVQMRRFAIVEALKEGGKAMTRGGRRLASRALVVAELTLALIFLGGAGVLLRSFELLRDYDPGFNTDNLLVSQFALPESRFGTEQRLLSGVAELEARLASLPGVEHVCVTSAMPRTDQIPRTRFSIDARPPVADQPEPSVFWMTGSPSYFETLEIPLLEGRAFTADDAADASAVAVINAATVERYWGEESPLGQRITVLGRSREIVGMVGDAQHTLQITNQLLPVVYLPWAQQPERTLVVALRSASGAGLTERFHQELMSFDPDTAIIQLGLLDMYLERFWVGVRLITTLLRAFGALALVLAAIGTYGILAYSVAQRTHEIGVRMAIGASRRQVLRMIVRQGVAMMVIGIGLGIPGVLLVNQAVSALFENTVPIEMSSMVVPCGVLMAVTLMASFWPGRRAAQLDPTTALRQE